MRLKSFFISLLVLISFSSFLFLKPARADTFTLSGEVSDNSNNSIIGATVEVVDITSNTSIASTTTDIDGNYTTSISGGTYNIKVTPPSGSGFSSAIALSQTIVSDKVLNFRLVPAGLVTLSGHLYDSFGNVVPNQNIYLEGSGQGTTTDSNGEYLLTVTPGIYNLNITKNNNPLSMNVPQNYRIYRNSFSLTQSMILDITLPLKKVTLHVQDSSLNSFGNAQILAAAHLSVQGAEANIGGLSIGGGINDASGWAEYGSLSSVPPQTDSTTGNVTLWLLPNNGTRSYSFQAIPPNGSGYLETTLPNVLVTSDNNVTMTLQQQVTFSGHVYDSLGNAVPNQIVALEGSGQSATTNGSGVYTMNVSPGTYTLSISKTGNPSTLNVPQNYRIYKNNYSIPQSTTLDITLPLKKVDIHVQDAFLNAVRDVDIWAGAHLTVQGAEANIGGLSIGEGITDASGYAEYGTLSATPPKTSDLGNVSLWLLPNNGTRKYNFKATPPTGSIYQENILSNAAIINDTNLTVTLRKSITLRGHIYDSSGVPLANQLVYLEGTGEDTTTDVDGAYTLSVSAGTYMLNVAKNNNPSILNVPQNYRIYKNSLALTQDTVLDITLPLKQVRIHVQDAFSSPIRNISITAGAHLTVQGAEANIGGLFLNGSIIDASGWAEYGSLSTIAPETNDSGDVVLWLLPNNGSRRYVFQATPPSGSIYQPFVLSNINVLSDQTEVISLQYNHATPVTTPALAIQNIDGTYSDPTIVTLSATAADGYTVADTYYTVDGRVQQTYSAPFPISGDGSHTITYWSIDNSGVQEAVNTKTFTLHANLPPHVNPLSGGAINVSGSYAENGSFTDADSTSWTATVDYGDGDGFVNLPLNPDHTFSLNHQYPAAGSYTVTVIVKDDENATGTTMATVNVNAPPQITGLSNTEINYQDDFIQTGSFTDPDSTSWTGTVDYGDGFGVQPLQLNADHTFALDNTYPASGVYTAIVRITDNQGAAGSVNVTVVVNAPPYISQLIGATKSEGQTYSENGSFTDSDSSSWTATVNYGDGSGAQPLTLNPDNTFSLNHLYQDNGEYTVVVTITDNQGSLGVRTGTVTINNIAPSVGAVSASVNPIQVNNSTTASASFSDVGILDTHNATWNWGDGSTTSGTVTESDGSGSVSDTHSYILAGVYEITLTVTDKDGASSTQVFQYLSVYNPTPQGLFTGARMFTSPAGAFRADPSLSGQVQFGISVKYQNTIPAGNISMKFNAANLEFDSKSVTLLVTSNGKATLRGTGTINGSGNYTFMVTGLDGNPGGDDFIRFQIKDSTNTVVYDSQPGAADTADPAILVTAGQIIVH